MCSVICVTNRRLCRSDFLARIEGIAAAKPAAVILREKDLPESDYETLAAEVLKICARHGVPCIFHTYASAAIRLSCRRIHLPLPLFRLLDPRDRAAFQTLGASCHSVEEAVEAQALGCTYITAGHIFATDCKPGAPPRGLDFLREVCGAVSVPVYAIGGINVENIGKVMSAGARGACVMGGAMRCFDPSAYINQLKGGGNDEIQQK